MPPLESDEIVQRVDFARLDLSDKRATPEGGLIAKARIARTGVLEYTNADGTTRRELRLPADVFAKAALDSFAHATVTELHPGALITPLNWRQHAVGHLAGTPVQDGEFVASEVLIRDAAAVRKVESGEHREMSCGYQCKIDPKPGVDPKYGRFDCRQYEITGNHVAVGPPGWGRSGSQVALRLDGTMAASGLDPSAYVPGMAEKTPVETKTETPAPATKDDAELRGKNAALEAENKRLTAEAKERTDAAAAAATDERTDAAIDERVALIDAAKPHLDAKDKPWSHKGKSADAIRREVLAKLEPGLDVPEAKEDGAEGWIRGAFGVAVARAVRATSALRRSVLASPKNNRADTKVVSADERRKDAAEGTGDMIQDAADKSVENLKNRFKKKKDRGSGGGR